MAPAHTTTTTPARWRFWYAGLPSARAAIWERLPGVLLSRASCIINYYTLIQNHYNTFQGRTKLHAHAPWLNPTHFPFFSKEADLFFHLHICLSPSSRFSVIFLHHRCAPRHFKPVITPHGYFCLESLRLPIFFISPSTVF